MPHKKGTINPGLAAYHERRRQEKLLAQDVTTEDYITDNLQPVSVKNGLRAKMEEYPEYTYFKGEAPMDESAFNRFMGYN